MGRKHTHKYYYGLKIGGDPVWACALPNCSHYMPKHMEGLVEGKMTICWKCEEKFELVDMKRHKPLCMDCLLLVQAEQRDSGMLDTENEPPFNPPVSVIDKPKQERILCPKCRRNDMPSNMKMCVECVLMS